MTPLNDLIHSTLEITACRIQHQQATLQSCWSYSSKGVENRSENRGLSTWGKNLKCKFTCTEKSVKWTYTQDPPDGWSLSLASNIYFKAELQGWYNFNTNIGLAWHNIIIHMRYGLASVKNKITLLAQTPTNDSCSLPRAELEFSN